MAEPPFPITGDADRYDHREGNDDYSQPGALFRLFDEGQRQRLFNNIAEAMDGVPQFIIDRQLGHFDKANPNTVPVCAELSRPRHGKTVKDAS